MIHDLFLAPFAEPAMRTALAGCVALAFGGAPIGVFLVLRRTSLIGDALSHAILPGVAIAFVFAGFSVLWMTIGGLPEPRDRHRRRRHDPHVGDPRGRQPRGLLHHLAGLRHAARPTFGTDEELVHVLFGRVLELKAEALLTIAEIATATMAALAVLYRPLIARVFDPGLLRRAGWTGALTHTAFLSLVVLNLIGGFQALGTLMAVGLMLLQAASAGFWSESAGGQIAVAIAMTIAASLTGLLFAFHAGTPPPESTIVLTAGVFYLASLAAGPRESIGARLIRLRHLEA